MTNEPGTTLQDIEAKAERKREAFKALILLCDDYVPTSSNWANQQIKTIRKYIEEN